MYWKCVLHFFCVVSNSLLFIFYQAKYNIYFLFFTFILNSMIHLYIFVSPNHVFCYFSIGLDMLTHCRIRTRCISLIFYSLMSIRLGICDVVLVFENLTGWALRISLGFLLVFISICEIDQEEDYHRSNRIGPSDCLLQ